MLYAMTIWGRGGAGENKPCSPSQLCTRTQNKETHTHAQDSCRKANKRLTKLIAYTLIFNESWVVEGVPTVQDLRVLADHGDAPQG